MAPAWIRKLLRRENVAGEYGTMSAEERVELERLRQTVRSHTTPGLYVGGGKAFDRELDAEEGRPPR